LAEPVSRSEEYVELLSKQFTYLANFALLMATSVKKQLKIAIQLATSEEGTKLIRIFTEVFWRTPNHNPTHSLPNEPHKLKQP